MCLSISRLKTHCQLNHPDLLGCAALHYDVGPLVSGGNVGREGEGGGGGGGGDKGLNCGRSTISLYSSGKLLALNLEMTSKTASCRSLYRHMSSALGSY